MASEHIPVLLQEFLEISAPADKARLLDGTLGLGGHTAAFLAKFPNSTAVGIELDEAALHEAKQNTLPFKDRITYVHGSYYQLKDFTAPDGMLASPHDKFSHILLDLGIGSHQLSDPGRGFSFAGGQSLTMRYGQPMDLPAANVEALNTLQQHLGKAPDVPEILKFLPAEDLAEIITTYGEEKYAWMIANAIKQAQPRTSERLAEVIKNAVPGKYQFGRIHPATRTFQALRLAVNRELEVLQVSLPQFVKCLLPQGKLIIISFHSLEDRIVKQFMKSESTSGHMELITKKPITASEAEIAQNPRSRSAKMRVASRVGP